MYITDFFIPGNALKAPNLAYNDTFLNTKDHHSLFLIIYKRFRFAFLLQSQLVQNV